MYQHQKKINMLIVNSLLVWHSYSMHQYPFLKCYSTINFVLVIALHQYVVIIYLRVLDKSMKSILMTLFRCLHVTMLWLHMPVCCDKVYFMPCGGLPVEGVKYVVLRWDVVLRKDKSFTSSNVTDLEVYKIFWWTDTENSERLIFRQFTRNYTSENWH